MNGITQSKITVTLRNPLDYNDQFDYYIIPYDNQLAKDWVIALTELIKNKNLLEKNFCFVGFSNSARNLEYLCNELNKNVKQINLFNQQNIWKTPYIIEDYYSPNTVMFGDEYPIGYDHTCLGLSLKHTVMNSLHNHFERLKGTVWNLSDYYKLADYETKYAIRQLNNLCHEIESLVLSIRKKATAPEWVRPSQITTFLQAPRFELTDEHKKLFNVNGYDRKFGHVYMHWTQIGKTLFEVFRDENAPSIDKTVCEAINSLQYYSGEFDIEWGNDIVYGSGQPWHDHEQDCFKQWLIDNNFDPTDNSLCLGYLPIGYVDINASFGTDHKQTIWDMLSTHLDIYKISIGDDYCKYEYCWADKDHKKMQIDMLKPGYEYSSSTNM